MSTDSCGHCYCVAQILSAGRTIRQLALLRRAELKAAVMQALEQLATEFWPADRASL